MSNRLRCYKQQQRFKLLAQFVFNFKVSAFRFKFLPRDARSASAVLLS